MANIFSSLWNGIKQGASSLWNFAKPVVSGFLGIPSGGDTNWGSAIGEAVRSAVGPLVSAGTSWLMGDRASDRQQESTQQQQQANLDAQREFAQNGIRWKVEDAKAAGLHPLFALGGSGAAFAPNPVVLPDTAHYASTGQNLGRAASAMLSSDERQARQLQLAGAAAQVRKDLALTQFYESEAARNRQQSVGSVLPDGVSRSDLMPGDIVNPNGTVVRPLGSRGDSVFASSYSVDGTPGPQIYAPKEVPQGSHTKGESPFWSTFVAGNGFKMDLPAASSASEALEAVAENNIILSFVVSQNVRKYGQSWLRRAASTYPDLFGSALNAFSK